MKLRFEVDQAEAFRRGIDCPKSIVTIEVNPAELDQASRNLIADRLDGIDVCQLRISVDGAGTEKVTQWWEPGPNNGPMQPVRVKANAPSFEALMEAIQRNQDALGIDILTGALPKASGKLDVDLKLFTRSGSAGKGAA